MALIPASLRRQLLHLARTAMVGRVRRTGAPDAPWDLEVSASGVFVTIYCRGQLRGCLGTLDPCESLAAEVVRLAAEVADRDYRFTPLASHELDDVVVDLSVLTTPEIVEDPAEIVVGRHGLIIELGGRRGLLLPQVAPEHGWDRETFLAHTCIKAGLTPDAWQKGATILRFEAEVFGEREYGRWH